MKEKVESALDRGSVSAELVFSEGDQHIFQKWKQFSRNNHPAVIQVSVSSVITNAPIILTMDCDMCSTNPTSPHRALCYFLDPTTSAKLAFVQFPQRFQGLNKNDIYGCEMKRLTINSIGMDGFCARRALFDSSLKGANDQEQIGSKMVLDKAIEAAGCDYEVGTKWRDTPSNPWFYLYAYLFLAAYIQDMADFVSYNGTFMCWWSDQRMWLIRGLTAFPFGMMEFVFKQFNIITQRFNVTSKVMDHDQSKRYDQGFFDFGVDSPFFVILDTAAILSLCAFTVGMIRDGMVVEVFLAGYGVVNCWPVYEALFLRSDSGRMPKRVGARAFIMAGVILAIGFVAFNV